ncbi:hypothetical protein [Desulfotignum balticum]|uniref:Nuclear transport factor 2 family protein n=1 Tax=Desulfotignum balticum TaxID=115781 RepID=A0A931CXL7_9BACT|nr:hypothetical protein [Desulfotignum balticum]MBG0780581.1 hypothetical protein [Desulfotignum balticum]
MKRCFRSISLLVFLIMALGLYAPMVQAETADSPEEVVKTFTHKFFMLDEDMADYLSREALYNENDVNRVAMYFRLQEQDAARRGLEMDYLKMRPLLIKTRVVEQDEDTAVIELSAVMVRSINPLYRIVGYVFGLIEEHEFETTVTAVKEDGTWKVGPGGFPLPA